jgi:hypothetical protein
MPHSQRENATHFFLVKELAVRRDGIIYLRYAMLYRKAISGISTVNYDDRIKTGIYDLYGRKLNEPRKGINIMGGKKLVVK